MNQECRKAGPPVEVFIWWMSKKVGRTWRRELLRNIEVPPNFAAAFEGFPAGRYRLEWRDARRWICHVESWQFDARGLRRLPPASARRRRKVPPPQRLQSTKRDPRQAHARATTPVGAPEFPHGGVSRVTS